MKILALSFALLLARTAFAGENPYDLLGHAIVPFAAIFTEHPKDGNRALVLSVRLEQMTGLPNELAGAHAEIAVECPDKLRVRGPIRGQDLTICRNGQEIWVSPGSRASALLQTLEGERRLPRPDPDYVLAPFKLPIPEKDLVLLPALFRVRDAGDQVVDGLPCRVLDVQLNPALTHSLDLQGWTAQLWLRKDATPVRLVVTKESIFSAAVRFDTVAFQRALPPETWQPTAEQAADTVKISPARYNQLLRAIVNGK